MIEYYELKSVGVDVPNLEFTKDNILRIVTQIKILQKQVQKHIKASNIQFIPEQFSPEEYLDESSTLLQDAEALLQKFSSRSKTFLNTSSSEISFCLGELAEASLGLKLSERILKIDDLFLCMEEANGKKEYMVALDLLCKLRRFIYNESEAKLDGLFQNCECFESIKVRYHIQTHILEQNLIQRFQNLFQYSERLFSHSKCITLLVSKDKTKLQDTIAALFQARLNPINLCNFLLQNCFKPIITKPVSIDYSENNEYFQFKLSYSLKDLGVTLRPSYRHVFESMRLLLGILEHVNVYLSSGKHVFSLIGAQIKQQILQLLVTECLMNSIPETIDEFEHSDLVKDVLLFEQMLADTYFIDIETDRNLTEFTEKFEKLFHRRFCTKVLDNANNIINKGMQDMILIEENTAEDNITKNPLMFPCCMISKNTLDLIKLLERIILQSNDVKAFDDDPLVNVVSVILNSYIVQVPQIHETLLRNIPQQSALFYNNCMFLAKWVAYNSDKGILSFPSLVKSLQHTGKKYLQLQITHQQQLISDILKNFDLSEVQTIGILPLKLSRQCLRQLDLLKNVWINVLPDIIYNEAFQDLLNTFCAEIISKIFKMEDISATVANEISYLIETLLEKGETFFKDKREVLHMKSWTKLKHLKIILNASLLYITEQWSSNNGILNICFTPDEVRHLIRALFQNTEHRAKALTKII